jgi:hypothetical protein
LSWVCEVWIHEINPLTNLSDVFFYFLLFITSFGGKRVSSDDTHGSLRVSMNLLKYGKYLKCR